MQKLALRFLLVFVISLVAVSGLLTIFLGQFISLGAAQSVPQTLPTAVVALPAQAGPANNGQVTYNPPKLTDAPENIREAVLLGSRIMTDTNNVLKDYVGNEMKCTNCHFNGGITEGGKNGGIPLVGVAAVYPKYRERQKDAVDMVTRTYDWLRRSENGKVLPTESKELTAMLTYFQWISKGVPIYAEVPWLGIPRPSVEGANKDNGQQVYAQKCAACHGADGSGTQAGPAVWGDKSYNDGAGMARPETLNGFALLNMPRGNPNLTEQEAKDVAVFVNSQPRPVYNGPNK